MARRTWISSWRGSVAAVGGIATLFVPATAGAQTASDERTISPDVMILFDQSGSMEWRNSIANSVCVGSDGGVCDKCSNGESLCSPACPEAEKRNRWTTALEVLTGTIQNFSCIERTRTDTSIYDYDSNYPIPYHEPQSNGYPLWDSRAAQDPDGILDAYLGRVRFGLMTFDNDYCTGLTATDGGFSYGTDRTYRAHDCTDTPIQVNLGARRPSLNSLDIVPGGLVSVGDPNADTTTLQSINQAIQNTLTGYTNSLGTQQRGLRPYGGTPIAALLEDAREYWNSNTDVTDGSSGGSGDPFFKCRQRFNILITDGKPNMDFRPACQGGNGATAGACPYVSPDQTAMTLASSGAGSPAAKTFVIAFNAMDPDAVAALTPIAVAGGTNTVLYATDRPTLRSALSQVLDQIATSTSTRTAPAFSNSTSGGSQTLYQFQSSFVVASGYPWSGVLERRRTICQGTPSPMPVQQNVDPSTDEFGDLLKVSSRQSHGWGTRRLFTYVPPGAQSSTDLKGRFATSSTGTLRMLDNTLAAALVGEPDGTSRDQLFAWLRGDIGTIRETRPLGDIFHSNPLVVTAPTLTLPDQTFADFRLSSLPVGNGWRTTAATVASRESVLYVGTNDGILHAFNADTGEEIWGFVPPYLAGALKTMYPANHQFGVDGSPVAREVVFSRTASNTGTAASWATVLVVGLRGGGGAYEALDVTDPYNPKFLWQFTDKDATTGTQYITSASANPGIGSVFTSWSTGVNTERAVAILPGGGGTALTGLCGAATNPRPLAPSGSTVQHLTSAGVPRSSVNCWTPLIGQSLYVVDMKTGQQIYKSPPTGSPLVGSPALYLGTAGTLATRAYVGDSDGGVWRLDMSNPDPTAWKFELVYDLFSGGVFTDGQPIVSQPVLSPDVSGNGLLITVGTGDPDHLAGTNKNVIATFRESIVYDSMNAVSATNYSEVWSLKSSTDAAVQTSGRGLVPGERLTGPISLFNGGLYYGTFVPLSGSDACVSGYARLWGVDLSQTTLSAGIPDPRLAVDPTDATVVTRVTTDLNGNGVADDQNTVLYGVGIVRQPSCTVTATTSDPYNSTSQRQWVSQITGGDFQLVVQTGRGGTSTGGSRTNVVSRPLPPPSSSTRINAWAVVFE